MTETEAATPRRPSAALPARSVRATLARLFLWATSALVLVAFPQGMFRIVVDLFSIEEATSPLPVSPLDEANWLLYFVPAAGLVTLLAAPAGAAWTRIERFALRVAFPLALVFPCYYGALVLADLTGVLR